MRFTCSLLLAVVVVAPCAVAQREPQPQPEPVPLPPPIASPVDRPYGAPMQLTVDATNFTDRVEHVHEDIPIEREREGKSKHQTEGREMVLLYPEWIPGDHAPSGPLQNLGGLVTTVDGQRVQWVRDRVNVYAFHVPLPAGAKSVGVDFDYLSAIRPGAGRVEFSKDLVDLEWSEVVLYPAGYFTRDIPVATTLKLPDGWRYATALETASNDDHGTVTFEKTSLNTLVDSPLFAGKYFSRTDISPTPTNTVHIDIVGDSADDVLPPPEAVEGFKRLTLEADKLYGSHHYKHYDFLLLVSDVVGGVGLEHHQSSEDGWPANYLVKWKQGILDRDLLGHEYTHSWNGKFRRPADLWTANFSVPMRDDLLWVYEGMTQYWGNMLTARAGMRTPEQARDILARTAAGFADSKGRNWRPLVDTTNEEIVSHRRPVSWVSWQRPEDYYTEGMLIWLDADTKIRQLTQNQRSLDDFCKRFFGVYNGSFITDQYTFEDVVRDLNEVAPYDWKGFLQKRVYDLAPEVPMNGFSQGGYKLVYSDTPITWEQDEYAELGIADFSTSLGLSVSEPKHGGVPAVGNVNWDSPAFKAGITPGMTFVSVNGTAYSAKALRDAILAAEKDHKALELQLRQGDDYKVFSITYYDGLRYPTLQRVEGTPDLLDDILAPSKSPLPPM